MIYTGNTHDEVSLKKISESIIKKWNDPIYREKQIKSHTGIKHSKEWNKNIGISLTGREFSETHCKNISESKKKFYDEMSEDEYNKWYEKTFTEERNKKISVKMTGKTHPWQNKINKNPEKIRKTAEKNTGSKRSEETKLKMSLAKKGKKPHNKGKVYCYNPKSLEKKLCFKHEIPFGWIRGFVPK